MGHDNCNCGHDHEHDGCGANDFETVMLSLDGETDVECYILGTFEVEDRDYIALQPKDDDEAMIFRYSEIDEEVQLDNIESDEEYEAVAAVFYELFDDSFDENEDDFDEDDEDDESSEDFDEDGEDLDGK